MKKTMFVLFVAILFTATCYAKTKNRYGYSVSAKLFNEDNIGVAVADRELGFCFVSTEEIFGTYLVFAEKEGKDVKYFYTNNYNCEYNESDYKKTKFTISDDAERFYISIDEIFPNIEASRIFHTVFYALGGKTGSGNWSTKEQIAKEEEKAGRGLRNASLENWKKEPACYTLLKSRIKYWKKYNDEVKGWLAEIVKQEHLSGYDDLIEYVEQL